MQKNKNILKNIGKCMKPIKPYLKNARTNNKNVFVKCKKHIKTY